MPNPTHIHEQAEDLAAAIDNHRHVLALLPSRSTETAHALKIAFSRTQHE